MKILVVEDQEIVIVKIRKALEGYELVIASSFEEGCQALNKYRFDMVLMDVILKGTKNGLDLCAYIRASEVHQYVQILILSQKDSEAEKMAGLNGGADDYLPKPFGVGELRSRVDARLRRAKGPSLIRVIGCLEFDLVARKVKNLADKSKEVELSDTEFRLLFLLADQSGKVFSLEDIAEKASVSSSRVKVYISKIRNSLQGAGTVRHVRHGGYFFEPVYTWQHVS